MAVRSDDLGGSVVKPVSEVSLTHLIGEETGPEMAWLVLSSPWLAWLPSLHLLTQPCLVSSLCLEFATAFAKLF